MSENGTELVTRRFIGGPLDGHERDLPTDLRLYFYEQHIVSSYMIDGLRSTECYQLGRVDDLEMMIFRADRTVHHPTWEQKRNEKKTKEEAEKLPESERPVIPPAKRKTWGLF